MKRGQAHLKMPKKGDKGVPQIPTVLRLCLGGCDRMFPSTGPAHRICPDCGTQRTGYTLGARDSGLPEGWELV
jgi:hypothetical protein